MSILVIGAGIASIATVTKLMDFGFDNIKILEAENRMGGRIHTIPFADGLIEMGAQW